ncbi:precorrin-6y C5,15-methyltransferase (decarboxylating) subunit CbiE [Asaia astilbis]|uniref:precorrin-6y C5,15-methyltransferase (decarboxylating) subunit CbiE n=1 Tax=Asaia astilbis TaxID=610244 RepID=UPI000AA3A99C|nr:precorrin-6y C5,15-methyltransferase (decarboxylating) subunit CbiE [Asaia astilbis]
MPSLASLSESGPWLTVIGLGEDGFEALSRQAQRAIVQADHIMGGTRHLSLIEGKSDAQCLPWPSPFTQSMQALEACAGKKTVVLASGDPFCFGVGTQLVAHFGRDALEILPARSCVTLACSRLGWAAQEVSIASLCGRPIARLRPLLQRGARLLVLSADEATPAQLASWLTAQGCGHSVLHLLEALDGPRECVRTLRACDAIPQNLARLNMIGVEVVAGPEAELLSLSSGLPDRLFEHDGQLTKQEIRAVTLSALGPYPGQILWDLGAGSGSVGIEWMLRHPANRCFAVERAPERVSRILRNAEHLGVPELHVEQHALPCPLPGLPVPDAVFVGGGVGVPGVLDLGWSALKPGAVWSPMPSRLRASRGSFRLSKSGGVRYRASVWSVWGR